MLNAQGCPWRGFNDPAMRMRIAANQRPPDRGRALADGDLIEFEVEGIDVLRNQIPMR